jgi:glutathione S-transferase
MRAMPTLTLTYFDSPGRAEPIRIALHVAGVPFEDRRLQFPDFAAEKAKGSFPLGSLPVLEVDGTAFPQTAAILRYVARLGDTGLYPSDPHAALVVDSVLDSFNDTLSHALTPSLFERDKEKKLAMRRALVAGTMATVYRFAEQRAAASGGPFVVGVALSIADLVIATQIAGIRAGALDGITMDDLAPYPRLLGVAEATLADPRVASYFARK